MLPPGLLPAYAPEEAKSAGLEPLALSLPVAGLEPLALSMPEAETSLPLRTGLLNWGLYRPLVQGAP